MEAQTETPANGAAGLTTPAPEVTTPEPTPQHPAEAKSPLESATDVLRALRATPEPEVKSEPKVEAAPPETKQEPAKEEPKAEAKPDPLTRRFEMLSKRDQELRQREQTLKEREAKIREYEELRSAAEADPLSALTKLGLSYEKVTEAMVGRGAAPKKEEAKGDPRVEKLAQLVESLVAEREQAKLQAARQAGLAKISELAKAKGEQFEYVNAAGAHDAALSILERHYEQTGEILGGSYEAGMELALQAVEEDLEARAQRLLGTSKARRIVSPVAPEQAAQRPQADIGQKSSPRTLTNSQAAAATPAAPAPKTDADYLARAIEVLRRSNGL